MRRFLFIICMIVAGISSMAFAAPVTYQVTVNTSSISGTTGSLDFNFNPGPLTTQAATVQILGFSTNGKEQASPTLTGDVSGNLPGTIAFNNGAALNDYFQGFTYGSTLTFEITLSGPALSAPDGVSTSGSTFAFSMFSDAAGTMPVLTSDTTNGFALIVNVNLDGTTTFTNYATGFLSVPLAQTISFGTIPTQIQGNTLALKATASSGLPITYTSASPTVCTVSGSTATFKGYGTCGIVASQAGNSTYAAATPVSQQFTVEPLFTITPTPSSETSLLALLGVYELNIQSTTGYTGTINLTCSGGPSGSLCLDIPQTVRLVNGKAVVFSDILFPLFTRAGTYTITFTGTAGAVTNSATATFTAIF